MDNSTSMNFRQNYPLENSELIVIYPTEFSIYVVSINTIILFNRKNI